MNPHGHLTHYPLKIACLPNSTTPAVQLIVDFDFADFVGLVPAGFVQWAPKAHWFPEAYSVVPAHAAG